MKNINCVFDGACEPRNPGGRMGIGAAIFQDRKLLIKHSSSIKPHPDNTNNIAEYEAIIWILKKLIELNLNEQEIKIYGDSNLVINQLKGYWKIKKGAYVESANRAQAIVRSGKFRHIQFIWIPRSKNTFADKLSKMK